MEVRAMDDYQSIFNARGESYNAAGALCPQARQSERATSKRPLLGAQLELGEPGSGGEIQGTLRLQLGFQFAEEVNTTVKWILPSIVSSQFR